MQKDDEAIKKELSRYYDEAVVKYHESNYKIKGRYSPLECRQSYIEKMVEGLMMPDGAKVLDVGCGPGELTLSLLKAGFSLWAVDISQAMVDRARENIQANGFDDWGQSQLGDIEMLEFAPDFFDIVIASGVLEYQREDDGALSEMKRVLKPGGFLILNVTNRFSYVGILNLPYTLIRKLAPIRSILDVLKEKILSRGPITQTPGSRTHVPGKFDKKLAGFGLQKIGHNYFHFSPFPAPFCPLLGPICGPVGRWMEKLTNGPLGFLGGGYLVLAKKDANQ
jgi:ubiquinone/menaquinone biosynthesis C-methylase UbiE